MSQPDRPHALPVYTDTNDLSLAAAEPQPSTHGTNSIYAQHRDRLLDRSANIIRKMIIVAKATGGIGYIKWTVAEKKAYGLRETQ